MCDIDKGYRGCKPNPDIVQRVPDNFHDFVMGFCENQEHYKVVKCEACVGSSLCESAAIEESCVSGIFICVECGYEKKLYVDMAALREMYDVLKCKQVFTCHPC